MFLVPSAKRGLVLAWKLSMIELLIDSAFSQIAVDSYGVGGVIWEPVCEAERTGSGTCAGARRCDFAPLGPRARARLAHLS